MKSAIHVSGPVSQQLVSIKQTKLDSDLRASITFEFLATTDETMLNYMRLVRLQGEAVALSAMPGQLDMFDKMAKSEPKAFGGNGEKKKELVHA
jgi:hypothetical protein